LIYKYFWFNFADKIIENLKKDLNDEDSKKQAQFVLYTILKNNLKLLHPYIPFITEYIWDLLPIKQDKSLIIERF
jgi:valyl-tRNA synthetase